MVTRNRQQENENESCNYEDDWEWSRFVNRSNRPTQVTPTFTPVFTLPAPVKVAAKRGSSRLPIKIKVAVKRGRPPHYKNKRDKNDWHWKDHYKNRDEWRIVNRNIEFFTQPLNYHWDRNWAIRHCEIQYEGESDSL